MRKISVIFSIVSIAVLSGCTGGTTYGTGVSHEQQTAEGFYNLLALKPDEKKKIDYSARPDLVLPSDGNALPSPDEQQAADQNWPVSPEERIAIARGEAPEVDVRSGLIAPQDQPKNVFGVKVSKNRANLNRSPDQDPSIRDFLDEDKKLVKIDRDTLEYSSPKTRRYLTEPPVEYRTPTATAEAGDLGYDSEYLKKMEKYRKALQEAEARGTPPPDPPKF